MFIQTQSTGAVVLIQKLNSIKLIIQYNFFKEKGKDMQLLRLDLSSKMISLQNCTVKAYIFMRIFPKCISLIKIHTRAENFSSVNVTFFAMLILSLYYNKIHSNQ